MRFNLKRGGGLFKSSVALLLSFIFIFQTAFAQPDTRITGIVSDSKGETIPGATVKVKGTTRAVSTTVNGTFSIQAKAGEVLVITSVGYTAKEVPVTGEKNYKIQLTDANTSLKEIVVVGYGTSSRKTLSSSISSVKAENLNQGAIADVGQLLQGKVPGLNITASGDPNKPAAVILRGASTVNSPGGPFYVIDGIPNGDITTVAPADIVSIDVLKDAAATAIYGNRAASGVIMVTTKRGKKGQSQVAYSGYAGIEKVSNTLDLMNADQLRAYAKANGTVIAGTNDAGANVDWMKAIERTTAYSQNHNLSLSGGGEHGTYSGSLNYFKKQGILDASSLERVIGRLNIDQYTWNDKLRFNINVSNSVSNANNTPLQNIVLLQAAKRLPMSPVTNADGSYFENLAIPGYFNPVAIINNAQDNTKYNTLMGSFVTELKLPFGLKYNVNLSYQKTSALHGEYYSSYFGKYPTSNFYNNPDPGLYISHTLIGNTFGTNGSALRNDYSNTFKNIETFLTWDKQLGDHNLNAVLGYSYQDYVIGEGFQASSTNFPADNIGFQNLSAGVPYAIPTYRINLGNSLTYQRTLLISDFFRLNYNYKQKYLLQASIRRDGSSTFGANNRWGYFPSVGASWRIIEEGFMKNQSLFDDLKLRVSYGVTGNSSGIGAYNSQLLYTRQDVFYYAGPFVGAFGPQQAANADLKWERTSQKDIGVDFSILKGKLSGSVDVYDKNTSDMLFLFSVSPAMVPGGRIYTNAGGINNKGVEVALNASPVKLKDFSWSSSVTMAMNKNKITSLQSPYGSTDSVRYSSPEGPGQSGATVQLLKTGYPVGQFFTYKYAGKDANGKSLFYRKDGSTTTAPAQGTDYFYTGNAQPKVILGWANTFKYKRFDLNVFLRGTFGNKIYNATRADLSYTANATQNNILNSASGDKISDVFNSYYSDRYLENGSYVRLDNATLGYTFDKVIKNVSSVRLYVTGNNIFTITKYKGIDPEVNQGGIAPGVDYNNFYPKTRTFLLGINVTL
ncbi:TonB-dependent receptor [Mucilaginibacter sp. RS28]|uniref:TonB-dependent receptor n=1 Tax=Mucilaginibacter straminoryzae TaxID=2932774 RepID=A0A9X2B8T5_9SPHI|nr:TonB-dependent receptor [Mucilaginibacter straminoryzae]MCJ8209716.1 TonB-dependent receptor [Mucilaginibacter straminoryzae]